MSGEGSGGVFFPLRATTKSAEPCRTMREQLSINGQHKSDSRPLRLVLIYMSRDTGYEVKGASVVGKLWSSLFGRVVTDRQPPTAPSDPEKSALSKSRRWA